VSNSIRELITWKLVRRVPVLGDRRDHYEVEADLWQILTRVFHRRCANASVSGWLRALQ
jgi:DNA-binding transcriptional regulator GbsR (MarR family)